MRTNPPSVDPWAELGEREHLVQFYDDSHSLIETLDGFIGGGLRANSAGIVIATREHIDALDQQLAASGVDVAAVRQSGQYVTLEAAELLQQILANGWPQPDLFRIKVGSLIDRAHARWGSVRAFGEMVGLLWEGGAPGAALRLESLWNELAEAQAFTLLCGYDVGQLRNSDRQLIGRICSVHGQVSFDDGEPQPTGNAGEHAAGLTARLQRRVQRLERELQRRKLLETRVAEREMELADFLENSVVGLHKIGADGSIIWANRAELDLLGYAAEEYIGRPIADFVVQPGQAADMLQRATAGEAFRDEHVQLRCKDGSTKDVVINSNPLLIDGKFICTRSSMRDVTAQWTIEGHLRGEAQKWEILHRTGIALSTDLDLERIVQTVTDAAVQLANAEFGAFFYNVDQPEGGSYMLYSLSGAPREAFAKFPMPRATALFGPTFRGERIMRIDDVLAHPDYGMSAPYHGMPKGHLPVRSYLAVPVIGREGKVHGGLFFGHSTPGVFTHRDELMVGGIAAQAAIAMENAHLFRDSQQTHQELQQLNDELEQRVAERTNELARSEVQFRELVSGVVDYAIYMLDIDGNIASWNAGAERIKGYSKNEAIGKHFSMFYTPEDREKRVPWHALTVAATMGKYEAEAWRVRKDGQRFWASVVIDAIYDGAGMVVGFAKVTRDLTERRAIEEQLRQSQKMEAIGQLTGGVAHDFNNLLTVIVGNLETIWRHAPPEDGRLRRAIDQVTRGAQRAVTLTQQLLAFSRRQPLNPKPTDINRLVAGMSDLIRRTIGESIAVETVLAGGLWRVEIDAHQLENALLNLAVNARDAMPEGGKLTIETANAHLDEGYADRYPELDAGQYVALCVTDTGTGMSADVITRAFEPFYTTKPIGQGTGLGLSQVYGFVKQSGGHVKLYSEVGEGTTVKIYLPRMSRQVEEEEEPPFPLAPTGDKHEVVLVVEDDDDVRLFTTESLRELGFTVVQAHDAPSALKLLELRPEVQLIFTDVGLPGMNGAQLVAAARALRPDIKVLFTTGYARNAIVHQGRLDPGVELITKPFTRVQLASRIRDVLDVPVSGGARRPVALVIEDEGLVRMFIGDQLNDLGFDVIDAGSAAEGLRAARNHEQLDVAIVDRGLPDRDGLDVVAELRTQLPSLPVIVASGYGDLPGHESLLNDAHIRFMSKPYDVDALTTALRALHVRTKEMR
ncbi:MAG TPA: response regulator [Steroidobacteraceae bacterium]|jgi:PAS domain S-box-containing protein|nr:response regulator [Steroidobacteraceae bacterium]